MSENILPFESPFSKEIWDQTYHNKETETTIEGTWWRVAKALSTVEKEEIKQEWEDKFYHLQENFRSLIGGRITANAGTGRTGTTLINCYVGPNPKTDLDSINGIYEYLLMQTKTLKSEGGWGGSFAFIRPRGTMINSIGMETPGSVKFMEIFDKASDIITAGSGKKSTKKNAKSKSRKGAMLFALPIWHPDIEEFITAKLTPNRLTKANLSVALYDDFMEKVIAAKAAQLAGDTEDAEKMLWDLVFPDTTHANYKKEWDGDIYKWREKGYPIVVYKTVPVLELWEKIIRSTYERSDPGVLFIDRANKTHCFNYGAKIYTCNPCVTGDTVVYTADGRMGVTIKQLADDGKDVDVFCYNQNKTITIRKMRNPRISGYKQPILKITLDDGSIIRVTKNHKFLMSDDIFKQAEKINPGDSLKIITKFEASIKDIFPKANSNSQDYFWVQNSGAYTSKAEHRIIAAHAYGEIQRGFVVHHKDRNGQNNHPDNLEIMSVEDHNHLHCQNMFGDKNPMRRAKTEWSEEKWATYRKNMSNAVSKEKNGRYTGFTSEQVKEHAILLTKKLGHRFSTDDWKKYAKETGLPIEWNGNYREQEIGSILDLAKEAAKICGIDDSLIDIDPRLCKTFTDAQSQGYNTKIENHEVYVEKTCEFCHDKFWISYWRREQSSCSLSCSSKLNSLDEQWKESQKKAVNKHYHQHGDDKKTQQLLAYTELQFKLKKTPMLDEWANVCREKNISFRMRTKWGFQTFKELKEAAKTVNHRVVSVVEDGFEDVYNGTVDDYHNFFVGEFVGKTESGKRKWTYLNNLQCGEQMLPTGACCNLGSLNLTQFVNIEKQTFNFDEMEKYAAILCRMLDNVNDVSLAPLPEYEESLKRRRRIGCGITGWGSTLYLLGIRFASDAAEKLKDKIMKKFTTSIIRTSIDLAKEKGMFPDCDPEKHADAYFWKQIGLDKELIFAIRQHGIRNSALFSIQPVGNGSVYGNVHSGGCEPLFMHEYIRTVIVPNCPDEIKSVTPKYWEGAFHETSMFKTTKEGTDDILRGVAADGTVYKIDKNRGLTKEVLCEDYGVRHLKKIGRWNPKADWAVTANDLTVEEHLRDLQGFAKWMDSSISKTINVPNDYPYEKFEDVYLNAYKTGVIKGVTTYRAGTMMNVLASVDPKKEEKKNVIKRPETLPAEVHHCSVKGKKYFVMIGLKDGVPFEVFAGENGFISKDVHECKITKKTRGRYEAELSDGKIIKNIISKMASEEENITRLTSLALRHSIPLEYLVQQLERSETGILDNLSQVIARSLKKHLKDGTKISGETCPGCGQDTLIRIEGCKKCRNCDYSGCGG